MGQEASQFLTSDVRVELSEKLAEKYKLEGAIRLLQDPEAEGVKYETYEVVRA